MKKVLKVLLIIIFLAGAGYAAYFFVKSNQKAVIEFETAKAFKATIQNKTVATGKVIPEDEVEIKPNLSGIIEDVLLEEGEEVKTGDLIAKIKVVPNEASLNSAKGRVSNAEIVLKNAELEYNRNKKLYEKGIIADQAFNSAELSYSQAKQELANARNDLQIIKLGTAGGGAANTNIRATVTGTIIDIPVKKGDQVIESNNFNQGTTIAIIADLDKMIFEGKVDEAEVGKLKVGMPLKISLAAIDDHEYDAILRFIAPKGTEENGAVQFEIKADVTLSGDQFVRAGYSANATMVLESRDSVLSIKEEWVQYVPNSDSAFVEVKKGEQEYEKQYLKLGLSDGINTEVISGVSKEDEIKVWNKTEPVKRGDSNG
ncbi:efflux RND transporter periplasmic adaptor subunit [Reichenbachiella ulvae]|uniref:Efflux RND transporter periplasmic adaptor subunit n=1 Tax=Reichenbachiella ulvae TaxID=2980104 RepID=A0ABT3CN47_9BACT|nr:efflux RND transporter periplasmic adaptor subunit [Reichenbachiella ulvae]MCV9385047.1 efflux RND transporter periplasmic adaptor subunit [Reichenbachiella ulvae]